MPVSIQSVVNGSRQFAENFTPLIAGSLSGLTGLFLIYFAVKAVYDGSNQRTAGQAPSFGGAVAKLFLGGALLNMSGTVTDISMLMFGSGVQDIRGVMAYAPIPEGATFWKQVMEVCLLWVVLLGWAGAYRGLLLWNKAANGNSNGQAGDTFWQGMWHLIGGVSAVSLTSAIKAFVG